jgi:hypothetical protein
MFVGGNEQFCGATSMSWDFKEGINLHKLQIITLN